MAQFNNFNNNNNNNISGQNLQQMMSMSSPSHTPSPDDYYKKVSSYSNTNFVDLDKHGYVKKKTVYNGIGSNKPINGYELTVNYIGELKDGRNVDNTYISKEPHQFILGGNSIIYGLELAIKSMTIGEKAIIIVEPEYGYIPLENFKNKISDKKYVDDSKYDFSNLFYDLDNNNKTIDDIKDKEGKKSFKELEPTEAKKYSTIIYEVELLFIDKKPRKQKSLLSTDEKIEISNDYKSEGILSFKQKYYHESIVYFTNALDYLTQIPSDEINKILDLKLSLLLNTVNCLIHLNSYQYALNKVEEAFKIKVNIKCFYYRAIARMHLAEFELAENDINKLVDYHVDNNILRELRNRLKSTKEDYIKNTSKIYKSSNFTSLYDDKKIIDNSNLNKDNEANKYDYNYIGKDNTYFTFPKFNAENKLIYLDLIKNNNTKNPVKLKFEIFKQVWVDELIKYLSYNNNSNMFVYFNKDNTNKELLNYNSMYNKLLILSNVNTQLCNINTNEFKNTLNLFDNSKSFIANEYKKDKPNKLCLYYNSVYPPSEQGLLVLFNDIENNNIYITITLDSIDYNIREDLLVLGRCCYNNDFIKQISCLDEIKLISNGISFNLK